ncbi:hypothetical protein D9758_009999 [Tetrapyrgos nigripes]|uniref:Heterokaryon incompatibility domain-containing protein n=1 Tax=Tetrapyrgos nigripes TaxID=182062 RepID=A0A8H5CUA7_9AGAR|nr:hypothetical protein D9758_009999 [Tetrapyrgos nigripes]
MTSVPSQSLQSCNTYWILLLMRLLRTTPTSTPSTYIVDSFSNKDIPPYAILSHTWGDGEITLADLDSPPDLVNKSGYRKLESSCKIAHDSGFTYIWIDTCCIDKSSSAELSEVLNSMYAYYRDSVVCYVYLSDVSPGLDPRASGKGTFRESRWFTRGWTLQELLASPRILFYDREWNRIGTKSSLSDVIVEVTNVPAAVLLGHTDIQSATIALRMSWAATRVTTRPEDVAYCLMGIFGVHMPPLYGEGARRAFIRLQEEILKHNDDPTIFVWKAADTTR